MGAKLGVSTETRPNVKSVLMNMGTTECATVNQMKSSSINVYSFETRCEAGNADLGGAPSNDQLASNQEDGGSSTVFIIVIVVAAVVILALVVGMGVLYSKYRKASDTTTREINNPTVYGNSA